MKKSRLLIIAIIAIVLVASPWVIGKYQENNEIQDKQQLFTSPESVFENDLFEYDKTYILFMSTESLNAFTFDNVTYLSKIDNNSKKIENMYDLEGEYKVISYNQQDKCIVLYGNTNTMYIDENEVRIDDVVYEEVMNNTSIDLENDGKDIKIGSSVKAEYPTIGYYHTISMTGIKNFLPIGVVVTDTIIQY